MTGQLIKGVVGTILGHIRKYECPIRQDSREEAGGRSSTLAERYRV
jgi:hypothetical protein